MGHGCLVLDEARRGVFICKETTYGKYAMNRRCEEGKWKQRRTRVSHRRRQAAAPGRADALSSYHACSDSTRVPGTQCYSILAFLLSTPSVRHHARCLVQTMRLPLSRYRRRVSQARTIIRACARHAAATDIPQLPWPCRRAYHARRTFTSASAPAFVSRRPVAPHTRI